MVEGMLAQIGTVTEVYRVVLQLQLIRQLPVSKNIKMGSRIERNRRFPQVCLFHNQHPIQMCYSRDYAFHYLHLCLVQEIPV